MRSVVGGLVCTAIFGLYCLARSRPMLAGQVRFADALRPWRVKSMQPIMNRRGKEAAPSSWLRMELWFFAVGVYLFGASSIGLVFFFRGAVDLGNVEPRAPGQSRDHPVVNWS